MDISTISFELLREGERIIGFGLTASGEADAEHYCLSFPTAEKLNKANVRIEGTKILFNHDGLSYAEAGILSGSGGVFTHDVTPEEAVALHDLLECKGVYEGMTPHVRILHDFNKGFNLVVKR